MDPQEYIHSMTLLQLNGFLDRGSHLHGDLVFEETFRIDGKFEGKIRSGNELILGETAITTDEVADAVIAGIAGGSFLILPHPDVARMYAGRATDTDRWLRGMNKLQVRVEAAG